MNLKPVCQVVQAREEVIVTDGSPSGFPDVFLGVEIRGGDGQEHDVQSRIGCQQGSESGAIVPGSAVPQQQERAIREGIQDGLQMAGTGFSIHHRFTGSNDLPRMQVERAIEGGLGATGVGPYQWGLTARRPNPVDSGLQIEGSFIFRQDECVRRVLQQVNQFFSSRSSKSATWLSRRDLNTLTGRW
jgi:hypothetical protein